MSERLIARSPDLQRLRDEGYSIEVRDGYLLVHAVPYVAADRQIHEGTLITDLTLSGDRTARPNDHQVWFVGQFPCTADGRQLNSLGLDNSRSVVAGVQTDFRFSNKPPEGYPDYHEKITRYVQIISDQVRVIDSKRTAQLFKPIRVSENESVFLYYDTASTRAGIEGLSQKLGMDKVAIVGLGGTGSYVLDLVAKTHVR